MAQTVLILDFGGQYKELIARRVRECQVYSVVRSGDITPDEVRQINPIGIILTGGPNSVYDERSPRCDKRLFDMQIPILGICYGAQLLAWSVGGTVEACAHLSEYGKTKMKVNTDSLLYAGMSADQVGLMSHTDQITVLPHGFRSIATTDNCANASIECFERKLYGVQYHPEVESTPNGTQIIRNFLYRVCGAVGDYNLKDLETKLIEEVRAQVGDGNVLLALSGGVDSSVCAALLSKAIPGRLHCVFVDHGLMRKDEGDEVERAFCGKPIHFIRVNAGEQFLKALKHVDDPEKKRKIIGAEFIKVFETEAKKLPHIRFLAQGTIYPDVIESGGSNAATIKSHHNVGGLPDHLRFEGIVEPLRGLFKDEVRMLGRQLGLSKAYVDRQPFPGPGLGVRIMGEITKEKIAVLQEADAIFREEMKKHRVKADQYFAVLTDTRSVGVVGDFRTYDYTVALRAVKTSDFMTCEYVPISHRILGMLSARIVNEVNGVGRVVYDITGKPPATIEWC